jgi:hypothetical protein
MVKYGLGAWLACCVTLQLACGDDTGRHEAPEASEPMPREGAPPVAAGDSPSMRDARMPDVMVRDAASRPSAAVPSEDDGGQAEPSDGSADPEPAAGSDAAPASDAGGPADGGPDSGPVERGCVDFVMPSECVSASGRPLPSELRCTGLYGDWDVREPACGVREYRPAYELWSDGLLKRRWVSLPPGASIDASRPDAFVYPAGTQFWKEFRVPDGAGSRLAETRLLRKVASPRPGWVYTSYVWDADQKTARLTDEGVQDLHGSGHDVPTLDQCRQCHAGREDFVLGWDPVLLGAGAQGIDLAALAASGQLTLPPDGAATRGIPGDGVERAALGYLHANCGVSCHNPLGDAKDSGLFLRLDAATLGSVAETRALTSGLYKQPWENAKLQELQPPTDSAYYDLLPLRRDASLVLVRMLVRGSEAQMPPIGSRRVDERGADLVGAWIDAMRGPTYERP